MKAAFDIFSKSSTGVDWFIVDTDVGAAVRIHKAVDYWAKHIVDQIKNTRPGVRVRHSFPSLLTLYLSLSVCLQRAPSMPCPAVPDRPPRSFSNAATLESCSAPSSAYAPLDITTREQAGVYQTVASTPGKKKTAEKKTSGGATRADSGSSAGLYQPLVGQSIEGPSAYAVSHDDQIFSSDLD